MLQVKANQIALQPLYEKSTFVFGFLEWKWIFMFHIITEESGQHVLTEYLAFSSQNLKFTGPMSNDCHYLAGLDILNAIITIWVSKFN